MSTVAGSITAAAVVLFLRRDTSNGVAVGAGLLVALYPSQVLWSSLVLKDSLIWMSLSLIGVMFTWWIHQDDARSFVAGTLGLCALLVYLAHLRPHTLLVALLALLLAVSWKLRTHRLPNLLLVILFFLLIPTTADAYLATCLAWNRTERSVFRCLFVAKKVVYLTYDMPHRMSSQAKSLKGCQ